MNNKKKDFDISNKQILYENKTREEMKKNYNQNIADEIHIVMLNTL